MSPELVSTVIGALIVAWGAFTAWRAPRATSRIGLLSGMVTAVVFVLLIRLITPFGGWESWFIYVWLTGMLVIVVSVFRAALVWAVAIRRSEGTPERSERARLLRPARAPHRRRPRPPRALPLTESARLREPPTTAARVGPSRSLCALLPLDGQRAAAFGDLILRQRFLGRTGDHLSGCHREVRGMARADDGLLGDASDLAALVGAHR